MQSEAEFSADDDLCIAGFLSSELEKRCSGWRVWPVPPTRNDSIYLELKPSGRIKIKVASTTPNWVKQPMLPLVRGFGLAYFLKFCATAP